MSGRRGGVFQNSVLALGGSKSNNTKVTCCRPASVTLSDRISTLVPGDSLGGCRLLFISVYVAGRERHFKRKCSVGNGELETFGVVLPLTTSYAGPS